MNSPFRKAYNNAIRIARTEGHRIQNEAALNAQHKAKDKGADIVKQWDSTLDGRTRPEHREADGQIRELDEPFDIGGEKMQAPGVGGSARNVCNCRCCLLQRAKWALDSDFTKNDDFNDTLRHFKSAEDYEQFKKWYFSKENINYMNYVETLEKRYNTKDFNKLLGFMTDGEYNHFKKLELESPMWKEHEKIVKSMDYAVETKIINNRKYAEKFKAMTKDTKLQKSYLNNAKTMLKHRSGQNGEDLYIYNTVSSKWAKSTGGLDAGTPEYNDDIKNMIKKSKKGELVSFHNHPASMPPSANDINAAYFNGYEKGYVLCHNGTIYEYTAPNKDVNTAIYDLRVADFREKGYTEFEAQLETMKYLSDLYGFSFKEVK